MKINLSHLHGSKSGTPPTISWKSFATQWVNHWQKFWANTKAQSHQQKLPRPAKLAEPVIPAILFYFIERGRRSYQKGISFSQWSDRMIIVHGNSVIPYLDEAWQYVRDQSIHTDSKQTMKTKLIITALVAFILTGLFPPWQYTTDKDSVNGFKQGFGFVPPSQGVHSRRPAGYSLLFTPPTNPDGSAGNGVQIDFGRLVLEWAVLAAITGVVWMLVVKPAWSRGDKSNRSQKFISPPANPGN